MDYIQVNITISPRDPWTDLITQDLADIGFDSFMEEGDYLQAFVAEDLWNQEAFNGLIAALRSKVSSVEIEKIHIPSQNWNATWEADYQPVKIDNQLLVRAPFHEKEEGYALSLEIQPQMSFGTGHHQTTYLLCQTLLQQDFNGKSVLDVGTGTGILGILASKLGATQIIGTDIVPEAVENTRENAQRNNIDNFTVIEGDIDVVTAANFDVIIANINRNVLVKHMQSYAELIKSGGDLFLSGFFETDAQDLIDVASNYGFHLENLFTLDEWAVLKLKK